MELLVKLFMLWIGLSIFIMATAWYVGAILKSHWPAWWKRVVMDADPGSLDKNTR